MIALKVFILVGTIDSHDGQFATVELNLNPATNGGPAMAVMPVPAAIPAPVPARTGFRRADAAQQQARAHQRSGHPACLGPDHAHWPPATKGGITCAGCPAAERGAAAGRGAIARPVKWAAKA